MLSEDEVRALLHAAGDTVEVSPAAPVTPLRPRRRTPLLAAAAAALLLGAPAALWGLQAGDPAPDDAGLVTQEPVDRVPEGTIPSLFAHNRDSARVLLESLGLRVTFRDEISCLPKGRPVGVEPAVGTPFEPGDEVTVLLSYQGRTTDCVGFHEDAWAFLDFANGRGPAPAFAQKVTVVVDGGQPRTLSAAEAARGEWGDPSALTILREASLRVLHGKERTPSGDKEFWMPPELHVSDGTPPDAICGVPRSPAFASREGRTLRLAFPTMDVFGSCPSTVSFYTTNGRIDGVMTWTERDKATQNTQPVPDVVGLTLDQARERVTAAGYTARVEEQATCDPRENVVEQAPTQQMLEEDEADDPEWSHVVTLVVEVPDPKRDCAALREAAEGLIRLASGGAPPRWAPRVDYLLGYEVFSTLSAAEAGNAQAWTGCSGLGYPDCLLNPLSLIARGGPNGVEFAVPERTPYPHETCEFSDRGGLPLRLVEADQINIYPADVDADCSRQWQVQVWVDAEGRVDAVNLLWPRSLGDEPQG